MAKTASDLVPALRDVNVDTILPHHGKNTRKPTTVALRTVSGIRKQFSHHLRCHTLIDQRSEVGTHEGRQGAQKTSVAPFDARGAQAVRDTLRQTQTARDYGPSMSEVHGMPWRYEDCNRRDLAALISQMLMAVVQHNDAVMPADAALTRFHAKVAPKVSIPNYLHRLVIYGGLTSMVLLSMIYYAVKLCEMYPGFTLTSRTVHRFLVTSAVVASKGLTDFYLENRSYASMGGLRTRELANLELELLNRLDWCIIPKPEKLVDYYVNLTKDNNRHTAGATEGL